MGRPFEANWPGECAECGRRFEAGDEIQYVDDEIVAYDCCGEDDE